MKDTELVAEARRQLANAKEAYEGTKARREFYLANDAKDRAYDRMLLLLREASVGLLLVGHSHYVLDRDAALAATTFAGLTGWMPFFDAARSGHQGSLPPQDFELLLEPAVCLLLAGDWSSLARPAAADLPGSAKIRSRQWRLQFVFDLIRLLRVDQPAAGAGDPPMPPKFFFSGYEALQKAIAATDNSAFEAQRARLDAEYPTRKKQRDEGLSWHGQGKLSQTTTFDALGTALCHLAVRRGLSVDADTLLYPRAFIHGRGK